MLRKSIQFLLAAVLTATAFAAETSDLTKTSIVLNWFPEAEHGGFYAALVEGHYKDVGLDVTIIPGGINVPVIQRVATGGVDFGVANADQVVFARAEDADIVAIMAPMQISPRIIMVHEDSGIKTLGELSNMTLAMSPTDAFATFIAKNYPLKNVKIVPYPGSPQIFLNDKNFAQQAYNISEPFTARKLGANPHNLSLAEAGYNPYTSCIVTNRKTLETKRELVRKFVQASVRGWDHYMRSPEAANAAITKSNPEMGPDILKFGVETMQTMVYTKDTKKLGTGAMTVARWKELIETMTKLELTKPGQVHPEDCFTTEFLPVQAAKPNETTPAK